MTTTTLAPKYTTFTIRLNKLNGNYLVWAKNPATGEAWSNTMLFTISTLGEAEAIVSDLKAEMVGA
jgi:predicted secreted protein